MPDHRPTSLTGWLPDIHGSEYLNITSEFYLTIAHADERIVYANRAVHTALGYDDSDTLIGLALADVVAHDGADITSEILIAMAASAEKMILRLLARNGDRIMTGLVAAKERAGHTYIILRRIEPEDIADICAQCGKLMAAETRAESAMRFMRSVLEQAPFGVMFLDRTFNIRWMNGYVRRFTHWELDSIIGLNIESIVPARRAAYRKRMLEYALREDGIIKASFLVYIRDALNHGRYQEFNSHILPLIRIAQTVVVFLFSLGNKGEDEIGSGDNEP